MRIGPPSMVCAHSPWLMPQLVAVAVGPIAAIARGD